MPALKIFSGSSNPALAEKVSFYLGLSPGGVLISRFASGEIYVRYEESIRGADTFLIQTFGYPVNENIMELLIMIDALRRASAGRITACIPYYAYARQEKKVAPREPITARMLADVLHTVGTDRIIVMDLHAPAIQGFFNMPVDHLTALPLLANYIGALKITDGVVVAPDAGSVKKAENLAARLDLPLGVMYKRRPRHNVAEACFFTGDVEGKTPIIIEDIIDTGGSILQVVKSLLAGGAKPEIYVLASHGVLSGNALDRMNLPEIKQIVLTDSLPLDNSRLIPQLKVISISSLLGDAIRRIHENISVSELFT
ncbi:MAG: ribose-phosphate diphosphokinase [Bacillota bacterium]